MSELIDLGSRRELFVDRYLVGEMNGTAFKLHPPQPAPMPVSPLRGAYLTVVQDNGLYRAWYRDYDGSCPTATYPHPWSGCFDGNEAETTCYAESCDGQEWTFPDLGICAVNGSRHNNVILARNPPYSHNFAPFLDANPAAAPEARYKALAGVHPGAGLRPGLDRHPFADGLHAFRSADGRRWEPLTPGPVLERDTFGFDSQNVSFWSEAEGCYVCYFRTWRTTDEGRKLCPPYLRTISRTTSADFIHWTPQVEMHPNLPGEHLYTSQTHPYFRAPHIYIALPTRFQPERGDSTDILFMATRAGATRFERLFTEAFIRPGLDPARWGNRANYAACGVVPTGPAEMSIYHAHSGRRYVLRTDGFVSVTAGAAAGEFITQPFIFTGQKLVLNYSTSAAGSIRVELQQPDGTPVNSGMGFDLNSHKPMVGDAIAEAVTWKGGDPGRVAGHPVRLRFVMQEADLFSLHFGE